MDTTEPDASTGAPAAPDASIPADRGGDAVRSGSGTATLLAALTAGAGVLHLVMAPIHAPGSTVEAAGFALAGWAQLVLAGVLLLRPSRAVLGLTAAANLVLIAVWAISRTVGLPVGAHPGEAAAVGAPDLVTVALQGVAVAVAALALARPGVLERIPAPALATVVPVAALLVVTLVVVSPDTVAHDHGTGGPSGGGTSGALVPVAADRCDLGFNPAAYWSEAAKAGVDTGMRTGPTTGTVDSHDGHAHDTGAGAAPPVTAAPVDPLGGRGSKKLDEIVPLLSSASELDAARVVMALPALDDAEYDAFLFQLAKLHGGHSAAHSMTGDDTGGHGGHMGPTDWVPMTDPDECAQLEAELELARKTALSYPTAADAMAAGWRKVTPYVPGIAAHYMNFAHVDGTFEVDKPEMLLYDGEGPEAAIVGLSYYVIQAGEAEPTQGFTGHNDHYHRHVGLCMRDGLVVGDSTLTDEECAAEGGRKSGGSNGWMSHAWVVPGCESPWGLFSGASPILDSQLSERSGTDGGGCAGSEARERYDLAPGAGPAPVDGPVEDAAGR
jgi:hypothetical protein